MGRGGVTGRSQTKGHARDAVTALENTRANSLGLQDRAQGRDFRFGGLLKISFR